MKTFLLHFVTENRCIVQFSQKVSDSIEMRADRTEFLDNYIVDLN